MVDFVGARSPKEEIAICALALWLGIGLSKLYLAFLTTV